ncbi:MAG TPA: WD40 repeat domain-containing protein [Pirellulales bacterium]|nr:WD40 repeat domain-containing protein [Pirellulales bacterium]
MDSINRRAIAAGVCIWALGLSLAAPAVTVAATAKPVAIKSEPLTIEPGKPLSARALVPEPPRLPGAISWTIDTRQHRGSLISMAVSPDGKQVATGGLDGVIRIWESLSGNLMRILVGHDSYVHSLSWSPDGDTLASAGGWDATIRLWNAHTGMPLRKFKTPKGYAGRVAWSPDGTRLLAAGDHSGWLWLWTAATDAEVIVLETGQDVLSIDWSPEGDRVAASIVQGPVTVVDVSSHKTTDAVGEPTTPHYCVRWSPDGKKLLVGDVSQTMIYEIPGGKLLHTLAASGYGAAWSPDGKLLCTTNSGGAAQLWNPETAKLLKSFTTSGPDLVWRQQDQLVARGTTNISGWLPGDAKKLFDHHVARVLAPVWTHGKPIVVGVGTKDLSLWDVGTAKAISKLEGHTSTISSVSWTRDGKVLASGSYDKTVRLWEAATGKQLHALGGHQAPVHCVAWSPDGKTLASGGSDNRVLLWNAQGKEVGKLEGHTKPVTHLVWSPRGNLLASGSGDGTIRLWNADKQQLAHDIRTIQPVLSLAFSPDGSILAGGTSEVMTRFWQTGNGQLIQQEAPRFAASVRYVLSVAWSPDGSMLMLAGSSSYGTQVWSWVDGRLLQTLVTLAQIKYVTWAPNGQSLIAGSHDGTVRFWDANTVQLRGMILEEQDHIVLLSSSGNYRLDKAFEPDFLFVLQTEKEQAMLSVADFASKYRLKNTPTQVRFTK